MLLDLAGGGMNLGSSWALSVKELEELGLTDQQARRIAGVPPTFPLDGWWVMLIDDEPYVPERSRIIEISGNTAICSPGVRGTVLRTPTKALVRFEGNDTRDGECITIATAQSDDFLLGVDWIAKQLPDGDPGVSLNETGDDGLDQADAPIAMAAWLYRQGTVEQILAAIEGRIAAAEPNDQFEDRRLTLPR